MSKPKRRSTRKAKKPSYATLERQVRRLKVGLEDAEDNAGYTLDLMQLNDNLLLTINNLQRRMAEAGLE